MIGLYIEEVNGFGSGNGFGLMLLGMVLSSGYWVNGMG